MVQPDRLFPYRTGSVPAALDLDSLRHILANIYAEYEREGYFQRTLGWVCVDDSRPMIDQSHLVFEETGQDLWPFHKSILEADEIWVFGIIEYLYSKAEKPVEKSWHSWNDCGWHVSKVDPDSGRAEFRERVNKVLARYGDGYELQTNGELWNRGTTGLEDLRPASTGVSSSDSKVQRAISQFRRHNATQDDKLASIRELADVLEHQKASGVPRLPSADETRLFEIANTFGIRHHNPSQRTDYDPLWLDWIFNSFLNAIDLATRLGARDA